MSRLATERARLREQAEHHLRMAPHKPSGGYFWRLVFVPLYRRMPWEAKVKAMHALRMTAESSGWTPPARTPGEPWRPPQP